MTRALPKLEKQVNKAIAAQKGAGKKRMKKLGKLAKREADKKVKQICG